MNDNYFRNILWAGVIAVALAFNGTAHGMIRTLPVEDLVAEAEHIVLAQVYSVMVVGTDPASKMITLRNEMKLIESLKGQWPARKSVILTTTRHEEHWIEDNVELPPTGTKVVLFLRRYKDRLVPVNGIQGVWPLEGNKLLQMGTGKTLNDIRTIVKSQKMLKHQ
ncbi:MAG TPA: hypothetical protein VN328_00925 [Thermodesulfovibrionales bacterium]|nr:hypothetical protein [Thermodesulfovibrionales bacterium]